MAGSPAVWDTLIKQCGAIKVSSLDEMIDTMKILLHAKPLAGNRVGLAAMTGGQSVVITDAFTGEKFKVPLLSDASYKRFATFFQTLGASYRNPLDVSLNFPHLDRIVKSLDILSEDENIDTVVLEISVPFMKNLSWINANLFDNMIAALADFKKRCSKPFITILVSGQAEYEALDVKKKLVTQNIPSFPSFERGANALRKAVDFYQHKA